MTVLKVGITGHTGRVGALLVRELQSGRWPDLTLAGGSVRLTRKEKADFFVTKDAAQLFTRSDAIIDFTTPESTTHHIKLAAEQGKPIVIGTTGLNTAQEKKLRAAAEKCPIVYAANTSVGVNLLQALVEQAAARLGPEWDIEINETHHRHKADAPSGTALALGRAAAAGRGIKLDLHAVHERHGHTGPRPAEAIGFSVQRGGDVAGEHTVFFFGESERLELTHRATDRAIFARGALRAASWLKGKAPGLYTMRDVLGL